MTRTVSPSPEQLERCDDQEMIERLTYLIQFYVYAEAEEKDVRDLVSSFGADDGYSGYAIVKESALESAQAEIARLRDAAERGLEWAIDAANERKSKDAVFENAMKDIRRIEAALKGNQCDCIGFRAGNGRDRRSVAH
jgi:hypothetical protein